MEVVTLSLSRNILDPKSRDHARMRLYAQHLDAYHIIVLTRREHGYTDALHEGNLHIYPTNSSSRLKMLIDAYRIGIRVIGAAPRDTIVSAQDPLEIGWVSFFLAWWSNTRFHVQIHGDYFSHAWTEDSVVRIGKRLAARLLLAFVPAIRVVSERIRRSLVARGIPERKITVLPIRPELESFLPKNHVVKEQPPYTLLSLGRLSPEKDLPLIIGSFVKVCAARSDVMLRIVGSGNEEEHIRKLIASSGVEDKITLLPWTDDVPGEMERADVFLLASKHEAYALTLIEAMAVGLPIITTDVGCVGEVVKNGVHGTVVKEASEDSYAKAILEVLRDPERRRMFSRNGKETAGGLSETTPEAYARVWVNTISKAFPESISD